jgi:hypothetical protein
MPSVDIVGAEDLLPMIGSSCPSSDKLADGLLRFKDDVLVVPPVGTVEKERWLPAAPVEFPLTKPDSG